MIEHKALVVKVDQSSVWIKPDNQSECQSCSSNKGCGMGALARLFSNKPALIQLETQVPLQQGDRILLGIEEKQFLKGSVFIYLLPILGLLAGALLAPHVVSINTHYHELAQIAGGLIGFTCAALVAKIKLQRTQKVTDYSVAILGKINTSN